MKQVVFLFSLFLIVILSYSQEKSHILMISIDGLRPEFYTSQKWKSSNLKMLKENGAYSDGVQSVFPSVTYPAHAAMVTGALPARSGIPFNKKKETAEWHWYLDEVKLESVWTASNKKGLITAAIQWPVSVSKDITYNIPEIWDTLHSDDRITMARKYSTPGLIENIEQELGFILDSSNMNEKYLTLDENVGKCSEIVINKFRPHLIAVHFAGLDAKQHEYGLNHREVENALAVIDSIVGRLWALVRKIDTNRKWTLLIVGDHGFADIKKVLRPNKWISDLPGYFVGAGGSAFLYPKGNSDVNELERDVMNRINELPKEQRDLFKVLSRSDLDKLGSDSNAVIGLVSLPGILLSSSVIGEQLSTFLGGHHGFDPRYSEMKTGFIAWGNKVQPGKISSVMGVVDVAPIISSILNLEMKCPDGKLIPNIINNN